MNNNVEHAQRVHLTTPELSLVARGFSVDAQNKYLKRKVVQLVNRARTSNEPFSKKS